MIPAKDERHTCKKKAYRKKTGGGLHQSRVVFGGSPGGRQKVGTRKNVARNPNFGVVRGRRHNRINVPVFGGKKKMSGGRKIESCYHAAQGRGKGSVLETNLHEPPDKGEKKKRRRRYKGSNWEKSTKSIKTPDICPIQESRKKE